MRDKIIDITIGLILWAIFLPMLGFVLVGTGVLFKFGIDLAFKVFFN